MKTRTDRRRCLALLLAVLIMITAWPVIMPDLISEEVSAATKHYPDKWSTYNFDSKGRDFSDMHNRNKGYYIAPNGNGTYPVLMYVHGAGSVTNITNSNLISLIEYWTEMGYMDEMVVVVPSIDKQTDLGYDDTYDCFRRFAFNADEGQKLVSEIYSGNRFDGKVNTKVPLHVAGFSMGGSVSMTLGVKSSKYCTKIGALSSSASMYLGDGNWGWFNYAKDIKFASNTEILLSYGKGEDAAFKTNSETYRNVISQNNPDVKITFNALDTSYGGHAAKLFTAELFTFLYHDKFGTLPSDELIKAALDPSSKPPVTPTPTNTPTKAPTPAKPTNLKAKLVTATKANISWNAVSGATGYEVFRSTSSNGTYSKCGAVTTTNRDCPGLTSWTTYYFKVRAYKEVNGKTIYGSYSSPVCIMAKGTIPKDVKAQILTATKIRLSWTAQPGASGYEVFRSTSSSGTYSKCGAVTTAYRDCPGLTTGTRYYFKVRSYKVVNGENIYSAFSSPVSVVPKATSTPTPTKKPTNTPTPTPVNAKLKSTSLEIMKGTFGDILFVNNGKEVKVDNVTYKSADTSIATVYADGSVAGLKEGNTKITVSYAGKSESVSVSVKTQINIGDKISSALTPANYSTIGNGSTDCTQAFRNLFKAAYDAGTVSNGIRRAKPIYIPSGKYLIKGSIIDSSMNISNCVFEVYGSGRESTNLYFEKKEGVLFDAKDCSPFVFTTFRDIGFNGNQENTVIRLPETDLSSQIKKPELQRIRFVSCGFRHFRNILLTNNSTGMISQIDFDYCKMKDFGTTDNNCKIFVLDDRKCIKVNLWNTDIEGLDGDVFYYKSSANVHITGGSFIPCSGTVFNFDFAVSGKDYSAGSKTTPHLICVDTKFELKGTTCCVRTNSIAPGYPIVYFKNAGMGMNSNQSPNTLIINGAVDIVFQSCTDCACLPIISKITSSASLKPRVRFYSCADAGVNSIATTATVTNPSTDANCVRVTMDDTFDLYLKKNSGSLLPYLHNATGLKECRQNVQLDSFDYIYSSAHSFTAKPYGYVRYAELTVAENTTYKNKTVNVVLKDKSSGQKLAEQSITLGAGKTYRFDINKDVEEFEVVLSQSFSTSMPVKVSMNLQLVKTQNPVADSAPVPVVSASTGSYVADEPDSNEERGREGSLTPQDFKAVADGKTDCTEAFRNMFKAAAEYDKYSNSWKQAKSIYIPAGHYLIKGSIIDESLGISYAAFEVNGAGRDNTFIEFVKDGILFDSEVKDQNNKSVLFAFTTFRNITFVGNSNNTFMTLKMNNKPKSQADGTQRMQFFSCAFKNWNRILYALPSSVMLSEFTFSDCKISDCGTDSNPCQLFVMNDSMSVNWRVINTDITNFKGDAFYYITGAMVTITGGYIIPKSGNVFFFDYYDQERRATAGPGNSPQIVCKGVKFGINANSSCIKSTSISEGAPVAKFEECNLGTGSYDSKKFLLLNGAGEIMFTNCTGCSKLRFSGNITSEISVKPHVTFSGCKDLNVDVLATESEVTNAVKDFNSIRVTVDNEYDFFMRKNATGLPYWHTIGSLNECRQNVKLDSNGYVVSGKAFAVKPYGYVKYAELAVPAASSYSGKTISVTLKEKSTGKTITQKQITLGTAQTIKLDVNSYVDELEVVFTHSLSTDSSTKIALKMELVKY